MNEHERKKMIKETFNTVAAGYDNHALRYFSESAKIMAACLNLKGDEHVLDVATGTGYVALAVCQEVPRGRVTGVDFSTGMLVQARAKAAANNISNVHFLECDMQVLEFPDNHFDTAVCGFGIFFVENMGQQLKHISDKVKPGGKVAICGFCDSAFLPVIEIFFDRIQQYGIERPPLSWKRIGTEEKVTSLYQSAGLQDICVDRKNIGYYLKNADEWWDVIWFAGFRGLVNLLSPSDMERFKKEHLTEVQELASGEGIWLNVDVLYTVGVKQ
ncbi:MAG: class I SAM-dependent methyltransferase [Gammaproteobacteria bacterium]